MNLEVMLVFCFLSVRGPPCLTHTDPLLPYTTLFRSEVLAARARKQGVALREMLIAYLPRYAPLAARAPWLMNLRDRVPGLAGLSERLLGFAAGRRQIGRAHV